MVSNDPKGADMTTNDPNVEPNDDIEPDEKDGTYNPSGGTPSHPADPGFGDHDPDDDVDESDDSA